MTTKTKAAPEKPLEQLTSAECRARLQELEGRRAELAARLARIRGPQGPATPQDPAPGCGSEYRRVLEAGSGREMLELRGRSEELAAELALLDWRSDRIRSRKTVAEAEEARAAAPGALKKLLADLAARLDAYEAALAEFQQASDALAAIEQEIPRLRGVTGQTGRCIDAETLLRWGLLRNHRVERVAAVERVPDASTGGLRTAYRLWGGEGVGGALVDLLGRPDEGVFRRLAERAGGLFGEAGPERDNQEIVRALRGPRYAALARGELEAAVDTQELARRALVGETRGERGKKRLEAALAE
jgi:hypothetical protein